MIPEIRRHIEYIFSQIDHPESDKVAPTVLSPATLSPPQATFDTQPFILVSPSDLVTLVKTLYPEAQQSSPNTEVDTHFPRLRSGASSVSAMSSSIYINPRVKHGFDSVSVLSTSGSSMTSDTTSREPLLDTLGQQVEQSISTLKSASQPNLRHLHVESDVKDYQEFGQELRLACSDMSRILGQNVVSGTCHPCAETWAIIYASEDGIRLSTKSDITGIDGVEEDDSYDDDSEDDDIGDELNFNSISFGRTYHQLKQAIVKLLTDFELPQEFMLQGSGERFSNHVSVQKERNHHKTPLALTTRPSKPLGSRNPYYTQSQSAELAPNNPQNDTQSTRISKSQHEVIQRGTSEMEGQQPYTIEYLLELAVSRSQAQYDFIAAHYWWTTLQQLRRSPSNSLTRDGYGPLLHYFSREARESLRKCASSIEASEAWLVWLRQLRDRQVLLVKDKSRTMETLRDKMWYVTDVRNSSAYEKTKNIVMALKKMARSSHLQQSKSYSTPRPRNTSRSSTANFTNNTEAQFFELMAASKDQGGPNKLADGQADKTQKWLMQSGVENFCKGEERIHRFCLEVRECVSKLVGENMLDGPVLWSSELYHREKEMHEDIRRNGTMSIPGITTPANRELELDFGRPRSQGHNFLSPPGHDIYGASGRNTSQHSFQSARWNTARDSEASRLGDYQDYFGSGSPLSTIDSSTTFWSPFHTSEGRVESNPRSRPSTAPSRPDIGHSQALDSPSRKRDIFLSDLKQELTNLLLSDLGTVLWSQGSETDAWFSGDIAQECMHRSSAKSANMQTLTEMSNTQRTENSIKEDQNAPEERHQSGMGHSMKPFPTLQGSNPQAPSRADQSTDSSNPGGLSSTEVTSQQKQGASFPYRVAYHRLFVIFSTHPSPSVKLQALYDLELLIITSLNSRPRHNRRSHRNTVSPDPQSPTFSTVTRPSTRGINVPMTKATRLEEVIANCEERRFNTMASAQGSSSVRKSTFPKSPKREPSTDIIVDTIQDLLRDREIRPETLFRDLQYIAAFVPADILDKTERGKAFWDVGLAALGLKQDVCRAMVHIADEVVAYHTDKRSQLRPVQGAPTEELARYGMEDAARMWMITAKEGDPVAERELAIFYLTHPELLPKIMLPLTMPRDTFKAEMMYRRIEDPKRSDPQTMCVAIHWMELSANGGDKLAKKYLRQRDELNAIP